MDLALIKVDDTVWSVLGVKTAHVGQAYHAAGVRIHGHDHAGASVSTYTPRLSKEDGPFALGYKASTEAGWSGAPLLSSGKVVGIHTYHDPAKRTNGGVAIPFFGKVFESDPHFNPLYGTGSYDDEYQYEDGGLMYNDDGYRWAEFAPDGHEWDDINPYLDYQSDVSSEDFDPGMSWADRQEVVDRKRAAKHRESKVEEGIDVDVKSKCNCLSSCCRTRKADEDFRTSPSIEEGVTGSSGSSSTSGEAPVSQVPKLSRNARRRNRRKAKKYAQSSANTAGPSGEVPQRSRASHISRRN
jgi:hypothetical protein